MAPALAVVCALAAIAFLLGRRERLAGRPLGWIWMALAAATPPLLIVLCLTAGGQLGAPRLAITKVSEDGPALAAGDALSLGSDATRDDLVSSSLVPGLVQVKKDAGGYTTQVQTAVPGPGAAVVGVDGGDAPLVGARKFGPGDKFCLAGCAAPDARWYQLSPAGDGLTVVGAETLALPRFTRRAVVDAGFARWLEKVIDWGPDQRIYPARSFGFELSKVGTRADACRTRYVCEADGATPAKSFLFRSGGPDFFGLVPFVHGGQLWIMLLDPGAELVSGGATSTAGPVAMPVGAKVAHLSLYSVRFDDPDWSHDPAHLADVSRLSTPHVVSLTADITGAVASLDTPVVREITRDDLTAAASLGGSAVLDLYGGGAGQGAGGDPLVLNELGGALAGNLRSHISFDGGDDFGRADHRFGFATNGAAASHQFGETVQIAVASPKGGQAGASLSVTALEFPWLMLLLPALWAALSLWGHGPRWRTDAVAWMIETLAQLLMALRWLVALEGSFLDPAVDAASLLSAGLCAYLAAPMALAAFAPRAAETRRRSWPVLVPFAILAGAATWVVYGRPDAISLAVLAIGAAMLVVSEERPGAAAIMGPARTAGRLVLRVVLFFVDLPFLPARFAARARHKDGAMRASTRWLTAAVLFRVVLLAFGVKERISVPAHLAVTVIYLPMLLIGFAQLFTEPARDGEPGWARPLRFWIWLPLTYLLIPSLARDHGFFLTLTLPVALWAAIAWRRSPAPASGRAPLARLMWPAPALVLAAALLAVLVGGPLLNAGLQGQMAAAVASHDQVKAEATLKSMAENDDNRLRLYMIAYPQGLEAAGTLGAEQVSVLGAQLSQYTGDLIGHGYLARSKMADEIRPVQMTDNVSALHVMSPFGRLGAAALLLLLAVVSIAAASLSEPGPRPAQRTLGLLALWSVFGAAAYIVLANLQLTPFTGRNVYLLAANSHSDLIEGLTLLVLAQVGLAEKRQ